MITGLLAKVLISIGTRLITSTFLSKLMIEALRAWTNKTDNKYDDRVVEAMAEALGVDPIQLKASA